jgi:hypothetical protein
LTANVVSEGENTSEQENGSHTNLQTQTESLTNEVKSDNNGESRGSKGTYTIESLYECLVNNYRRTTAEVGIHQQMNKSIQESINNQRKFEKTLKNLKNDVQTINAIMIKMTPNETSENLGEKDEITEEIPITTWAIIVLIIWNATLTIICAYHCCSPNRNGNSANASNSHMESPVCINPIYTTSTDMTDYNSTPENRAEQFSENRLPGSQKVEANPTYQPSMDQFDDGLYSEIII